MLANASNGLKTLGAIDLLQIARFAKGCIALSEGTEDARDHPRWYVSAPLRGKTPAARCHEVVYKCALTGFSFCRFPPIVSARADCTPSGQFAPSVIHKKHNGKSPSRA